MRTSGYVIDGPIGGNRVPDPVMTQRHTAIATLPRPICTANTQGSRMSAVTDPLFHGLGKRFRRKGRSPYLVLR
jgi:hypothetical protein